MTKAEAIGRVRAEIEKLGPDPLPESFTTETRKFVQLPAGLIRLALSDNRSDVAKILLMGVNGLSDSELVFQQVCDWQTALGE